MPNRATGSVRWTSGAPFIATARVTLAGERLSLRMEWTSCDELAEQARERALKHATELAGYASRMRRVDHGVAVKLLERAAGTAPGREYDATCKACERAIGGHDLRRAAAAKSSERTLDAVEELWFSGALARKYPDNVEERTEKTAHIARRHYRRFVKERLGSLDVGLISRAMCDEVKSDVPARRANSRRQMLNPLKILLDHCVLLGWLEQSPLPAKWLPKDKGSRKLQWLYPDEEAQLLACTKIPLWRRWLWGWYVRNGSRKSELIGMTLAHYDRRHGGMRLDPEQTKTGDDRHWLIDASIQRALDAWCALARPGALSTDRLFVDSSGVRLSGKTMKELPALLRADLRTAGITRPELFVTTKLSRNLVVHDLRATFVTVQLALGRSEEYVKQRTGHESSEQLRVYARHIAHFQELKCGDFAPLDEAIPELREWLSNRQRSDHAPAKSLKSLRLESYIVKYRAITQVPDMTKKTTKTRPPLPSRPVKSDSADASLTVRQRDELEELRLALAVERGVNDRMAIIVATLGEQVSSQVADAAVDAVVAELQRKGLVERARPQLVSKLDDEDE